MYHSASLGELKVMFENYDMVLHLVLQTQSIEQLSQQRFSLLVCIFTCVVYIA